MRVLTKTVTTFLLCVSVACFLGCGPKDGKIEVRGTVMVDDQPLPSANLAFIGGGGGIYGTASTNEEGKFTIRAAPGINQVSVAAVDLSQAGSWDEDDPEAQTTGTDEEMAEAANAGPKSLVAERYGAAETSGIEVDVQQGMSEVIIHVTKE